MKPLIFGMLVASPAVVYWSGWIYPSAPSGTPAEPAVGSVVSIPVEVIATGSAPKWIYVQVGNHGHPSRE